MPQARGTPHHSWPPSHPEAAKSRHRGLRAPSAGSFENGARSAPLCQLADPAWDHVPGTISTLPQGTITQWPCRAHSAVGGQNVHLGSSTGGAPPLGLFLTCKNGGTSYSPPPGGAEWIRSHTEAFTPAKGSDCYMHFAGEETTEPALQCTLNKHKLLLIT